MRHQYILLYICIVLISPCVTTTHAIRTSELALKTPAPNKVDISQYSKTVRKRSVFDEYTNADRHFKSAGRHSQVKLHLTSPKSEFHDWGSDTRTERRLENVQNVQRSGGVTDSQYVYQTDPKPQLEAPTANVPTIDLSYVGCFSSWEEQYTEIYAYTSTTLDENSTPESCSKYCREWHGTLFQLIYLKGGLCHCAKIFNFNSSLIEDTKCYIPCPIKDYKPVTSQVQNMNNSCGGNVAYSVYCWGPGEESCDFVQSIISEKRLTLGMSVPNAGTKTVSTEAVNSVLFQECSACVSTGPGLTVCGQRHMSPFYDYFPTNSPKKCTEYCGQSITYVGVNGFIIVRRPTQFALLTWMTYGNPMSICHCADEEQRQGFIPLSDTSMCDATCPGNVSTTCGGLQKGANYYATIYCVGGLENGNCRTEGESEESTTVDPCSDPLLDCDDPGSSTPTTESDPTTTESTSTPDPGSGSSTPTTENDTSTTTERTTPITTPDPVKTTTIRTNASSSSTPTTPVHTCSKVMCRKKDKYGHYWEVCGEGFGIQPCSELIKNSGGLAFWECTKTGKFATPYPDVANCSSEWLEDKHEELEKIEDINGVDLYIQQLSEDCKEAQNPDSISKYFGHEINNITTLIDLTVVKAREFSPPFNKFEPIVETAVDLSAFLIQYHEPWQGLPADVKSTISTNLLGSTEESLFQLNDVSTNEQYSRIFTTNTSDISDFLIFVEFFNKFNSNITYDDYEFPPRDVRDRHDSYIKLPNGWDKALPHNRIEIAAMSINSKYVNDIMPGQYKNLGTGIDPEPSDNKLINGKLISFSMMSSVKSSDAPGLNTRSSPRSVSFKDKGVEIVFQHDTEAWGDEALDLRRKLHHGEKPKAVLGSTQCVFWNVKTLSWSDRGCRIVSSSRHETVCECNHLTSFAVLMDVHRYVGKEFALELLTLILCPLSQFALVVSIILLSSVSGLQRIRATITKNLSICLFIGNTLVIFVLDRNYFKMSDGLCIGAGIVTHYIFLCAFMWMMIEGVQLYRMVVHVFDSGRSYIKHFGIFAYGSPLLVVAVTAAIGYLKGDKPYGGDVFCWLEGSYIWSFMIPVAFVTMINLIVLFIALKTAYQLQQSKKHSPTFIMGKIQSYKTWFKGCFSLTVILGLTWVVGFFTLIESPSGIVAAYLFTILNASQGIFIFVFHCLFNDKIRTFTRRNLSTYLPSWLTSSSVSSNQGANDASFYGKKPLSSMKSGESALEDTTKKKSRKIRSSVVPKDEPYVISKVMSRGEISFNHDGGNRDKDIVNFMEARNYIVSTRPAKRCESTGTVSSIDSIPNSIVSESGHVSSDTSQSALISKTRFLKY